MMLSVIMFSMMDALVKWLGSTYPTQQIMFFRCSVALIPVLVIIFSRGGVNILKTQQISLHCLRCLFGVLAMGFAFYAFSLMRLADAISILHTTPLFMTLLSIVILKETVGIRRWLAIIAGFTGMILVIRPGEGMLESGSLFMLIAALLIACTTVLIRHLSAKDDPVCITFYFTLAGIIVSSIAVVTLGWRSPPLSDWPYLIGVGLFGGVAQYLMTLSYRHAEIAIVAPLKYLSIAFGGAIGYWVWSEIPDIKSFIGIGIIVASGLYTLHRELVHANTQKSEISNSVD